jgi:hypothetical protein
MTNITLKQWIASVQLNNNDISSEYTAAALRIAIALSEQIIHAEELSDAATLPPPFPISCIDWAECITVTLNEDDVNESAMRTSLGALSLSPQSDLTDSALRGSLGALALSAQSDLSLEELLGWIAGEIEGGTDEDSAAALNDASTDELRDAAADILIDRYLNVTGAKLVASENAAHHGVVPREKLQRIYSMGLVFYRLFSGGELPPTELFVLSSQNGQFVNVASNSVSAGGGEMDDFAHTPHAFEGSHDIDGCLGACRLSDSLASMKRQSSPSSLSSSKRQSVCSRSMRQSLTSSVHIVNCENSIYALRSKGVPATLCDLIYNMIDCINGSMMGNHSYTAMFDVIRDLQLMLQKPSTFLDPLDMDRVMNTGLELDETMFGRDQELASLHCAYRRCVSESSELAIISGVSGSGKTTMANKLGAYVVANGGSFLSGKFDQMGIQSFSAIASAFDNFCSTLVFDGDTSSLIASKLRAALGSDLRFLVQMIPNL